MLKAKLSKHGNSQCILIPSSVLKLLGWDKDTLIKVSTPDGKRIVLEKREPACTICGAIGRHLCQAD